MLDVIRSNAQSFGVKVAFAIIIVVFVFWGVGNFTGGPVSDVITVNGEPITYTELMKLTHRLTKQIQERNPGISEDDLKKLKIKTRAAEELIQITLLKQEARRLGLAITPYELRKSIEAMPYFHNQEGKFDPEVYQRILKNAQETPGHFEEERSQELLFEKLVNLVTAGASAPEAEIRDVFNFQTERRILQYVLFPASDYARDAAPSPEAVRNWYESHKETFKVPAAADVDYLLIGAETLAPSFLPEDAAVSAYYEKNKKRFATPEQVRARHILLQAPEQAAPGSEDEKAAAAARAKIEALHKRLVDGADFATLARENSEDSVSAANGGELGWFGRGQMVPEFDKAAFELKPGEISAPIKTSYGYHILQVEEHKAAGIRPLEEVRESIRLQLGAELAAEQLPDVLDQILLGVIGGKSLEEAGKPYNLLPRNTTLLSVDKLADELGIKPEEAASLLTLQAGTVRDTPFITQNGYVLTRLKASTPEGFKSLDEVRDEISQKLAAETQARRALEAAKAARASMKDGTLPVELAARLKSSAPVNRSGSLDDLGSSAELARDAFNASPDASWLPEAYPLEKGAVLVRVHEIVPAEKAAWEQVHNMLAANIVEGRRSYLLQAFLQSLRSNAKIFLKNKTVLED